MSSTLQQSYASKSVFGGLDGLRFISIIAVVWHHATEGHELFKVGSYGFLGVNLFFVISGFLIVSLLLREKQKTGDISLKNFYIRRTLRIFPLYYGVILGLAAAYYLFARDSEFGQRFLSELPIYLLYVANYYPVAFAIVWSLASEEQFYLVWPFLEKHFEKFMLAILGGFIGISQLINFYREPIFSSLGVSHLSTLSIMEATFTPILLGALLAHLLHKQIAASWLLPLIRGRFASAGWLVVLLLFIQLSPADISGLPRLILQCVMMMLVASTVFTEDHLLNRALTWRPIARIGAISYGVYLFHIHGIVVAEKLLFKANVHDPIMLFFASMIVTVAVAECSFRFFEMPFLRLKARFSVVHQDHN